MVPKVGDFIYLPTELYLSHGEDDFHGGLCEVEEVKSGNGSVHWVVVKEKSGQYSWEGYLEPMQEELRSEFGSEKGHADPDYRPEFNESLFEQLPDNAATPSRSEETQGSEPPKLIGPYTLRLYQRVQNIASSLEYISKENKETDASEEIRERIEKTCERFLETAEDVLAEIIKLEEYFGSLSIEEIEDSWDTSVDRIGHLLKGEIQQYHALILFLRNRVELDGENSIALMLCQSLGADILKEYGKVEELLRLMAGRG